MVNYSKWDTLEISDDSDIEVHPNVDKRYESVVNEAPAQRVSSLISSLQSESTTKASSRDPSQIAFEIIMQSILQGGENYDSLPPPPEDVFKDPPKTTYSKMMLGLLDDVKETINKQGIEESQRCNAIVEELVAHVKKIGVLQADVIARIEILQAKDATKITSESYHTGFDSSHVNKAAASGSETISKTPELLNPKFDLQGAASDNPSTVLPENEQEIQTTPTTIAFGELIPSDYRASHAYIASHPEILEEDATDGLLVEAYRAAVQNDNNPKIRQYVHQAILLQCCRMLGRDGVDLFFNRLVTPGHKAIEFFHKDVAEKLQRIVEFAKEQREGKIDGVERIQIHAVGPGTEIQISVPGAGSMERDIFDRFAPEMQAALESGSIERVNEALGEMDVAEAESLIDLLNEAKCLNIEENIIDASTEEGKKRLEDLLQPEAPDSEEKFVVNDN